MIIGSEDKIPGEQISPYPVGLMIPMEDIFQSIDASITAKTSLPTRVNYQIDFLRTQRIRWRWLSGHIPDAMKWLPRHFELELLLAQQTRSQTTTRPRLATENLRVPSTSPMSKLHWLSSHILENRGGLHIPTLESILLLEDVCPLSASARRALRSWSGRHRRWNTPRKYAFSSIIFETFTNTQGGENVLAMLLFLWKTRRYPNASPTGSEKTKWLDWLAQLLAALFSASQVPSTSIPSLGQLEIFVGMFVLTFNDKDLKEMEVSWDVKHDAADTTNTVEREATGMRGSREEAPTGVGGGWDSGPDVGQASPAANSPEILPLIKTKKFTIDGAARDIEPQPWFQHLDFTARLLLQLRQIATGDKGQVLVCSGSHATWGGLYAVAMLDLKVEFRQKLKGKDGYWPFQPEFLKGTRKTLLPTDFIAYFDAKKPEAQTPLSEMIPRDSVKPLRPEWLALLENAAYPKKDGSQKGGTEKGDDQEALEKPNVSTSHSRWTLGLWASRRKRGAPDEEM